MNPTDALTLLSVRCHNRLVRKYKTLPETIGEFEFYKDYLQHFHVYDFPMGHFEKDPLMKPLLQQLIAGSYQHDYIVDYTGEKPELHVNVVTECFVLKGAVSAFSHKELRQLTNHLLVEQFDREAAVEEKKYSKEVVHKIREQRKALWEARLHEINLLELVFQIKSTSPPAAVNPGKSIEVMYGISNTLVPWIDTHYCNMSHLIEALYLSAIDLKLVARVFEHLYHLDASECPDNFFDELVMAQGDLECSYQKKHYPVDKSAVIERLVEWEQRFGPLQSGNVLEHFRFFGLSGSAWVEYKTQREQCLFHTPQRIKAALDWSVIGQEHAKRQISMVMYMHLLRSGYQSLPVIPGKSLSVEANPMTLPRQNVLLTGPTGSGKSFLLKLLCEMFQIPSITIDCASLTASGYVGRSLSDHFRALWQQYSKDSKMLERSVIIFDEFDKISEMHVHQHSVGGVEIQQEFLVLLEGDEYLIEESKQSNQTISIPTKKMMFVFSGSFSGIEKIIARRLAGGQGTLGFGRSIAQSADTDDPAKLHLHITTDDLISFGIIPELAGRVNHLVPLQRLTRGDYVRILKDSDHSPLMSYRSFFALHHHTLEISEEVYDLLAGEAAESKTGARSLAPLVNKLLSNLMWQAAHANPTKFVVDQAFYQEVMS